MITGLDLIQEQIRAAQGEVLRYKQEDIQIKVCTLGRPQDALTAREKLCHKEAGCASWTVLVACVYFNAWQRGR